MAVGHWQDFTTMVNDGSTTALALQNPSLVALRSTVDKTALALLRGCAKTIPHLAA